MQRNPYLKTKVDELVKLGFGADDISPDFSKQLLRLLRPSSADVDDHAMVVRHKLREALLAGSAGGSERASSIAAFEKECDKIKTTNPQLLNSFLAMMQTLSASKAGSRKTIKSSFPVSESQINKVLDVNVTRKTNITTPIKATDSLRNIQENGDLRALASEIIHVWVSKEVELKLIKDLLYIFQVGVCHYILLCIMILILSNFPVSEL